MLVRGINRDSTNSRADTLKLQVAAVPGVLSVTRSEVVPNDNSYSFEGFLSKHIAPGEESKGFRLVASDYEFFKTYKTPLLAGRYLDEQFADDRVNLRDTETLQASKGSNNVVLSLEAVKELGYTSPSSIINEQIEMELEEDGGGTIPLTVVGVVEDMQFRSARNNINPKIFFHAVNRFRVMTVRLDPAQEEQAIAQIKGIWANLYPETPYYHNFMEGRIERLYSSENRQLSLFMLFSVLTVVLSLVGLVGLVLNSISHRTKEISIRRVLGASVADNIRLFTWQYMKPVIIANIPAWAAAYYFLNDWLQKYPQRVELSAEYYLMGGGVILTITMILIAALVVRVASIPPAQALKYE